MSKINPEKKIHFEINKSVTTTVADTISVQKKNDGHGLQLSIFSCILENSDIVHFMEQSRVRISELNAKELIDHLCFHTDYYSQKEKVLEKFKDINNKQQK